MGGELQQAACPGSCWKSVPGRGNKMCKGVEQERAWRPPVSTGKGVRGEVDEARPACEVAGIVLCLQGRPLEDSSTRRASIRS